MACKRSRGRPVVGMQQLLQEAALGQLRRQRGSRCRRRRVAVAYGWHSVAYGIGLRTLLSLVVYAK